MPRAHATWLALVLVAGCSSTSSPGDASTDADVDGGVIRINQHPTGSIQVPSLCDRVQVDQRVTHVGVGAFAFLWTGSFYLVAYADLVQKDIFVAQLSDDGEVLGAPTVVDATPGASDLPNLVATPTGFAVAWQDGGSPASVMVHALDLGGRPTGSTQVVATGRSSQMRPVLSPSPQGLAIAWMDQVEDDTIDLTDVGTSTTYVALLDSSLAVRTDIPPHPVSTGSQSGYPWLAGDASRLALLWSNHVAGRTDTYFSAVDETLAASTPADVRGPDAVDAALLGRLAITDFGNLAAWEDLRSGEAEIYMSLLDPSGNRFAGGLVEEPNTGNANWPHVAWRGSSAGIVYYQFRNGRPQIFMTFIDQNGLRIGGAADSQVSDSPAQARFADVVWNGTQFAVLWLDVRDGQSEIYFNLTACARPAPI